jgi:hypothetical protein
MSDPFQAFIATQITTAGLAESRLYKPTLGPAPLGFTTLEISAQASPPLITLSWTPAPIAADLHIIADLHVPASSLVPQGENPFALLTFSPGAITSPYTIPLNLSAWHGTLQRGQELNCSAALWSDSVRAVSRAKLAICIVT